MGQEPQEDIQGHMEVQIVVSHAGNHPGGISGSICNLRSSSSDNDRHHILGNVERIDIREDKRRMRRNEKGACRVGAQTRSGYAHTLQTSRMIIP